MPNVPPAETRPERLRLRNKRMRAAWYRTLATLLEKGETERVIVALRRRASALDPQ